MNCGPACPAASWSPTACWPDLQGREGGKGTTGRRDQPTWLRWCPCLPTSHTVKNSLRSGVLRSAAPTGGKDLDLCTLLAQPGCTCTSRAKGPYTFCNPIPTHDSWYYLKRKNEGPPGRQARACPMGQESCWQNQTSTNTALTKEGAAWSAARW